jgi:hypothetical protein
MGLIRVNANEVWQGSAAVFDFILTEMQKRLDSAPAALIENVRSAAESHLHWWSLVEMNPPEFLQVFRAVQDCEITLASRKTESLSSVQSQPPGLVPRLKELIVVLSRDPRSSPDSALGAETKDR